MANITVSEFAIVLEKNHEVEFLKLIPGEEANKGCEDSLAMTKINTIEYTESEHLVMYRWDVECRWAIKSLIDGKGEHTVPLTTELLKRLGVKALIVHSVEYGCEIEESIEYYEGDDEISYSCREMYPEAYLEVEDYE